MRERIELFMHRIGIPVIGLIALLYYLHYVIRPRLDAMIESESMAIEMIRDVRDEVRERNRILRDALNGRGREHKT